MSAASSEDKSFASKVLNWACSDRVSTESCFSSMANCISMTRSASAFRPALVQQEFPVGRWVWHAANETEFAHTVDLIGAAPEVIKD